MREDIFEALKENLDSMGKASPSMEESRTNFKSSDIALESLDLLTPSEEVATPKNEEVEANRKRILEMSSENEAESEGKMWLGASGDQNFYIELDQVEDVVKGYKVQDPIEQVVAEGQNDEDFDVLQMLIEISDELQLDSIGFSLLKSLGILEVEDEEGEEGEEKGDDEEGDEEPTDEPADEPSEEPEEPAEEIEEPVEDSVIVEEADEDWGTNDQGEKMDAAEAIGTSYLNGNLSWVREKIGGNIALAMKVLLWLEERAPDEADMSKQGMVSENVEEAKTNEETDPASDMYNALKVFTTTTEIVDFLKKDDSAALRQANAALEGFEKANGESVEETDGESEEISALVSEYDRLAELIDGEQDENKRADMDGEMDSIDAKLRELGYDLSSVQANEKCKSKKKVKKNERKNATIKSKKGNIISRDDVREARVPTPEEMEDPEKVIKALLESKGEKFKDIFKFIEDPLNLVKEIYENFGITFNDAKFDAIDDSIEDSDKMTFWHIDEDRKMKSGIDLQKGLFAVTHNNNLAILSEGKIKKFGSIVKGGLTKVVEISNGHIDISLK